MHNNQTVTKSHELVAADIDDMTLKEAQLLALAISMIPADTPYDESARLKITIERHQLDMVFGLNGMSNAKLKQLAGLLQSRTVTVRPRHLFSNLDLFGEVSVEDEKAREWKRMVIVPTCEYKDGRFSLTLNQDLNEHFLELRERFTSYRLANIIGLSSPYHLRLYEILIMRAEHGSEIRIEPDRLRAAIGAAGKYPAFFELRRRVLDPGVKAISQHTDLIVDYQAVKQGNEVMEIIFSVGRKDELLAKLPLPNREASDERTRLIAFLMEEGLPQTAAVKVADVHTGSLEELTRHIEAAHHYLGKLQSLGSSINPSGVFYKAVKEKWILRTPPAAEITEAQEAIQSEPEEMPLDYERLCDLIETDRSLGEGFLRFLQERRDMVSLLLFQQNGLRGKGLAKTVEQYGQYLVRSGRLNSMRHP
jgi:hypothetical protein